MIRRPPTPPLFPTPPLSRSPGPPRRPPPPAPAKPQPRHSPQQHHRASQEECSPLSQTIVRPPRGERPEGAAQGRERLRGPEDRALFRGIGVDGDQSGRGRREWAVREGGRSPPG